MVTLLLQNAASTNVSDNKGCYPLHLAAWNGYADIVNCLLTHGPSVAKVNEQVSFKQRVCNGKHYLKLLRSIQRWLNYVRVCTIAMIVWNICLVPLRMYLCLCLCYTIKYDCMEYMPVSMPIFTFGGSACCIVIGVSIRRLSKCCKQNASIFYVHKRMGWGIPGTGKTACSDKISMPRSLPPFPSCFVSWKKCFPTIAAILRMFFAKKQKSQRRLLAIKSLQK